MPTERTPVQDAWLTLDIVASELDRTAYRRTHLSWERMQLMATKVREAREAFMAAVNGNNPAPPAG